MNQPFPSLYSFVFSYFLFFMYYTNEHFQCESQAPPACYCYPQPDGYFERCYGDCLSAVPAHMAHPQCCRPAPIPQALYQEGDTSQAFSYNIPHASLYVSSSLSWLEVPLLPQSSSMFTCFCFAVRHHSAPGPKLVSLITPVIQTRN